MEQLRDKDIYRVNVNVNGWGDTFHCLWNGSTTNRHEFLHREDGPAIERKTGEKEWWYHGERINCSSQEEFEKWLRLKAFW
jgi:hypothetical protein